MAVTLLEVGDRLSLEFESADLPEVRDCITTLFGEAKVHQHTIASEVTIAGESFTFQDFWDDPCLISSSANGDAILRQIHAELDGS